MPFNPRSLALYPDQPGVYLMKDGSGRVLYIGKAKNLQNRLKQYFGESGDERAMVPYLTAQVETIDTIIALTEKDALLLENTLIKKHQPKYNVLLKDDKTFISLLLTNHRFPMLRIIRNRGKEKGHFFGPYTNALAARQTYDLVMRLFPLRQCSDRELVMRKRPCLLYDMKKCLAPCVDKCGEEEYQKLVDGISRLLKGQDKELVQELTQAMHYASTQLEFEKADALLQTLRQIEHVTTVQHVDHPFAKDCDVLGLHRQADAVLIVLLSFREGKIVGSEHFSFHLIASEDAELFESFLLQHYRLHAHPPHEILLPCEIPHAEALQEILQLKIESPKKGKKEKLLEMARRNAKALFIREINEQSLLEKMLLDLQEKLLLTRYPRRIECFDTSHLFSTDPVASLCCFVNGVRDKKRTRLFRIKTSETSEDYASMREVLHRHFTREKETGDFCDLLVVDGGKGQLNIALEVFLELGIASVDVIALTKESARHDKGLTQEAIYLPHSRDPILIDPRSPMLFLLQRIRDETHRMAIEYHRKRRTKRTIQSALDDLPGIGPVKRRRLLTYYGSVRALKAASKESLQNVDGLTKKDVERVWQFISSAATK
jgi:excinuclease ABC subunit C